MWFKFTKDYDKNWLVKVYNQLETEKYIEANLWHKYADDTMLKNAKFPTAISAQKIEAKAKAVLEIVPTIKQAKIYTDFLPIIADVYNRSRQNGGSSTYMSTGLSINKNNKGYMVAKQNSNEKVLTDKEFTPIELERYAKENIEKLQEENAFLGTWFNDENGNWYLDSSEKIDSCILAMKLAIDRNQIAIYDIEREDSIYTKDFMDVEFPTGQDLYIGQTSYEDLLELKNKSVE